MNYNQIENKGYTEFKEGIRVKCIRKSRDSSVRPPVNLTIGKWYKVNKCLRDIHGAIVIEVINDEGNLEQYSSRRFKLEREDLLSALLDD